MSKFFMQSFSCDCSPLRDEISIVMACSLGRQGESIVITSPSILVSQVGRMSLHCWLCS